MAGLGISQIEAVVKMEPSWRFASASRRVLPNAPLWNIAQIDAAPIGKPTSDALPENMKPNTTRGATDIEWLLSKAKLVRTSWMLVLTGFLGLSILGCGALVLIARPVYSSHMVLSLTSTMQALVYTDAVLFPSLRKVGNTGDSDLAAEGRRLASRLSVSELTKGSGLFMIAVSDHSAQSAQAILDQILAQLVAVSQPSERTIAEVRQRLESQTRALTELRGILTALKETASGVKGASESEQYARSFTTLVNEIMSKEQELFVLESRLKGLDAEDVIVRPIRSTLTNSVWRPHRLAVIFLVSLALPVLFVLFRDVWRRLPAGTRSLPPS